VKAKAGVACRIGLHPHRHAAHRRSSAPDAFEKYWKSHSGRVFAKENFRFIQRTPVSGG
jgi:hypothetical protein